MEMLKDIVILLVGFVLLVKGADYFVEGSSSIAKILKVPSIVIGLTVVAMGTSLPELSVSVSAAISGSNEIAVSNVVGSNIFNTIVVLGACALLAPVTVDRSIMKKDFPFCIIITVALAFFCADAYKPWGEYTGEGVGLLSRINGIILLVVFVGYIFYTVKQALKDRKSIKESEENDEAPRSMPVSLIFVVCGAVAIIFGGDFVVDSAKSIALTLGMSETLVGLTIVAVGTSLPELVTSVVAARKGETGLAIGNVVGSNIFNILFILSTSSTISPVGVQGQNLVDAVVLIAISLVVFVFGRSKEKIEKKEGIVMILIYVAYMAYAIIR